MTWWFAVSAGNSLSELFRGHICLFPAASHWRPTVTLQLDNTSRAFSFFVIATDDLPIYRKGSLSYSPGTCPGTLCFWAPAFKVIQFSPCHVPAILTADTIQTSSFLPSGGFMAHSYLKWRVWESSSNTVLGECLKMNSTTSVLSSLLVAFVWLNFHPHPR